MEHKRARHAERCLLPDPAAYEQGVQQAIDTARELRTELEQHLGACTEAVSDFGHDINNAIASLLSVVSLASNAGTPLVAVENLLKDYSPRVDAAFDAIRPHVHDAALTQKIAALQECTDGLFAQLQLAREQHKYPQAGQLREVRILGTVDREGQQGIWL